MKKLLPALILLLLSLAAVADPQIIRPIFIIDGDTFIAAPDSQVYRIWGVDAPELDQPWGIVARSALIELIHRKRVTITSTHGKSYKRPVVQITVGGNDVALELLKMGLAWHTPKYAPDQKEYAAAAAESKSAKRGLWLDKYPVSPEDHRKNRDSADNL